MTDQSQSNYSNFIIISLVLAALIIGGILVSNGIKIAEALSEKTATQQISF